MWVDAWRLPVSISNIGFLSLWTALEQGSQLSAERRVALPGAGEDGGDEQQGDQGQQDGQHQHSSWHLGGFWWISAAGVRQGSAWRCFYQALVLTPGVGQAAGIRGGGVLEVPCLTGHTVVISLPNLTFELSFSARWAVGEWLAVYTLMVPTDAEHSWLAVALGFLFASARCSLLEAQDLVTGAAQLADGQMVPVLVVGVFRARGTNGVLITATFSGDVSAWGAAGAAGLMLGFVVFLFLVPAGLVLRVVWGQQSGLGCCQETAEA